MQKEKEKEMQVIPPWGNVAFPPQCSKQQSLIPVSNWSVIMLCTETCNLHVQIYTPYSYEMSQHHRMTQKCQMSLCPKMWGEIMQGMDLLAIVINHKLFC